MYERTSPRDLDDTPDASVTHGSVSETQHHEAEAMASIDVSAFRWAMVPDALIFSELSHLAVRVYAAIQRLGFGRQARASYRTIGERLGPTSKRTEGDDTGVSDAGVKRAIRELEQHGWIVVKRRRGPMGHNLPSLYRPLLEPNRKIIHDPMPEITHDPMRKIMDDPMPKITHDPSNEESSLESSSRDEEREPSDANASRVRRRSPKQRAMPQDVLPLPGEEQRDAPDGLAVARDLAHHLADAVASEPPGSKRPTVTIEWVRSMDRMLRIDQRTPTQVRQAIDWIYRCPDGEFWIRNVRSPDKLRAKFDTLRADKARASKTAAPRAVRESDIDLVDRLMAKYEIEETEGASS